MSLHQTAGVNGMEAVDIFTRIDQLQNAAFVDMFWQRKLDQNAVDIVAFVEPR